jgi:hypothetical protein
MGIRNREHACAALLAMLFALAYLWPALLAGKVLSPNSALFLFAPWRHFAPSGFEQTWNPLLTDIPTAYYPWNVFARALIHSGVFPAWNPDAYAGTPFFANAQTGVLSPLNLPLWILPLNYGIAFSAWLKLWIGGLGAYLFARELKLSFWPGMLAGVSFMLCAFNVVWLTYETLPATAAMMPWAFLLGERIVLRRRLGDGLWLAVVTGVAIAAGHPETAIQTFTAVSFYVAIRLITVHGQPRRDRLRGLGLALGAMAMGVLLSAITLLPVVRAALGTPGEASRTGGTLPLSWAALKTVVFPGWWEIRELPLPGPSDYNERTFYVGAAALILACVAVISRGRWREKLPLAILALFGVAASFGAPVAYWVAANVPPLNSTTTNRMLLWFELAVPILAAFGLQQVMDDPRRLRAVWIALSAAFLAAVVAVVVIDPTLSELGTTINHLPTGTSYSDQKIIALTSVGWWFVFAALVGAALMFMRLSGRTRLIAVMLVLLAAVDLLHFSSGYQPMLSPGAGTLPRTPAVAYLQRHSGQGRVVGLGSSLDNDYDMVYGLQDARGYDPPQPSYRYLHLWQLANPAAVPDPLQVFSLSVTGLKVMSLLGVRYVLEDPSEPPVKALRRSVAYRGSDAVIFENPASIPRALVARRVISVSGERAAISTVASADFDPMTEVIVEDGETGAGRLPETSTGGIVRVREEANSKVVLDANLSQAGVVVLDDAAASGWSVTIDGHQGESLRVDDVLRGVRVPAGEHVVTWTYRVPGLRLGATVSAVATAVLLLGCGLVFRRRRLETSRQTGQQSLQREAP